MLHFVNSLPAVLEPNNIYYVQTSADRADHYVADKTGNPVKVSTEDLVKAYMATLKGANDGYAELDGDGKVPTSQLPTGASPAEINAAIQTLDDELQGDIALKANASDVYTQSEVNGIESNLQDQIDGKQASLSNANHLGKIGDAEYDGNPFVLVNTTEW